MYHGESILRYDNREVVSSPLNPIENVTSWISGLNSIGYTSDILRNTHRISNAKEAKKCAQLISMYARNSIGLIEQAYSGPPEVSFLPLYYAILNLSKIYIVSSGQRVTLNANRWHGATYNPTEKSSRDLLTERIRLKGGGILPLFYETLTRIKGWQNNKQLSLNEIYPYIRGIAHEYKHAYKKPSALQGIHLKLVGDSSSGYNLVAQLQNSDHPNAFDKRYLKILTGFQKNKKSVLVNNMLQ